jgi:cytochrome bd ubiquinol oxidase subunit I
MLRTLSCLPPSPPPFGIANAKLAYQQYKALFHGERWDDLAARGATAQRCLWASTSVKDPSLCDTLYVEELIGPDTISTMPEQTIRAFQDHGRVELRLESDLDEAQYLFNKLYAVGVDYDDVVATLEREGIEKFVASVNEILDGIATKAPFAPRGRVDATASVGGRAAAARIRCQGGGRWRSRPKRPSSPAPRWRAAPSFVCSTPDRALPPWTSRGARGSREGGQRSLISLLLAAAPFAPVDQEYLFEARQMQALSFAVHIPLVCFGIAFPAFVLFMEALWLRTGDPVYRTIAKRWSKVMLALFAVGVVTGTILSFELGLLWPSFMATFGEVFGLGFTLEAFSFFVEAIFIAVYVYGWDRLSPRAHFLSGIPVAIAGFTGSLTVISVNAWMNNPSGFTLEEGRVTDVRPLEALFGNQFLWHEVVHMYVAAYIVAGFLTASFYAWGWLHGRRGRYERVALVVPLTVAALAAPVQIVVGDWAAREVAREQPIKLAAFEGLHETEKGGPVHLLGWYDGDEVRYGIPLPRLLSLLAFHDPNARVAGLEEVPADERPPVNVVRVAFQTMVGIGFLLAGISAFFLFVWLRRRRLPRSPWFYRAVVAAGPLSVVALIAGWVTTEVGRQPWVVYGHMRTEAAVTGASGIPVGYATLVLVYAGLLLAVAWILRRLARAPLDVQPGPSGVAPLIAGAARPNAEREER